MRAAECQVLAGNPQLLCQKLYHRCYQHWYQPDASFSHEGASLAKRHVHDGNAAFGKASVSCMLSESHEHERRVSLDSDEA
jgi:hypothetical protein